MNAKMHKSVQNSLTFFGNQLEYKSISQGEKYEGTTFKGMLK